MYLKFRFVFLGPVLLLLLQAVHLLMTVAVVKRRLRVVMESVERRGKGKERTKGRTKRRTKRKIKRIKRREKRTRKRNRRGGRNGGKKSKRGKIRKIKIKKRKRVDLDQGQSLRSVKVVLGQVHLIEIRINVKGRFYNIVLSFIL